MCVHFECFVATRKPLSKKLLRGRQTTRVNAVLLAPGPLTGAFQGRGLDLLPSRALALALFPFVFNLESAFCPIC